MKSVMLSIKPYWLFLIIAEKMGWNIGKEKTVEARKSCPKDIDWNKKVIFYCTKDKASFNQIPKEYQPAMAKFLGKVIGEFVCDDLTYIQADYDIDNTKHLYNIAFVFNKMCLTLNELFNYLYKGEDKPNWGWAWHISDLKIYDKPKELSDFLRVNVKCKLKDGYIFATPEKELFKLKRPPQSWCYVQE